MRFIFCSRVAVFVDPDGVRRCRRILPPGVEFRSSPVPGSGKRSPYRWFRAPRTRQELAAHAAFADDLRDEELRLAGLAARAGRRRRPPTAWDDQVRHVDRCWKRHRRRQAKADAGRLSQIEATAGVASSAGERLVKT